VKLKPPTFHILLALSEADKHGSAIVQDVLTQTDGALRLWPVTLYGSLDELRAAELIRELDDEEERPPGASRRRRYYRITTEGREALKAEADRLAGLARLAHARVGG